MAEIVLGIGTSHSPLLSTPWEQWGERVKFDQSNPEMWFRGQTFNYDELVALRRDEDMAANITPERKEDHYTRCQAALAALADRIAAAKPDVALIVGNDQRELFTEDNFPAFAVYWGKTIENRPRTEEQSADLPPGIAIAERGHAPPRGLVHPGCPELGRHVIQHLMDSGFDVAQSAVLPRGSGYVNGIPHAYGFVYRRLLHDKVMPNVPVVINTFYPPNQPSAGRCYALGESLREAVESWDEDRRVVVIGSGGLSHFVIDEELDRTVLDAIQENDVDALTAVPEDRYQSGSSEWKNWIGLAGAMSETPLEMKLLDYVPCYRSMAGTGNAMGFAVWE